MGRTGPVGSGLGRHRHRQDPGVRDVLAGCPRRPHVGPGHSAGDPARPRGPGHHRAAGVPPGVTGCGRRAAAARSPAPAASRRRSPRRHGRGRRGWAARHLRPAQGRAGVEPGEQHRPAMRIEIDGQADRAGIDPVNDEPPPPRTGAFMGLPLNRSHPCARGPAARGPAARGFEPDAAAGRRRSAPFSHLRIGKPATGRAASRRSPRIAGRIARREVILLSVVRGLVVRGPLPLTSGLDGGPIDRATGGVPTDTSGGRPTTDNRTADMRTRDNGPLAEGPRMRPRTG